jgi:hypothetical protein
MGVPLMIQEEDNVRIEHLKKDLGISKKIDVIRAGLKLLEEKAEKLKRIKKWQQAAKLVAKNSQEIHKEFQPYSRIKKIDS